MQGIFFEDIKTSYIPDILNEIYKEQVYRPYIEDREDLVILDVGANIGLFTLYASQFAKKVYSVEPAIEHLKMFDQMVKFNQLGKKVTIIPKALSHRNEQMMFWHNPDNKTMYSLNKAVSDGKTSEVVDAVTMDKVMEYVKEDKVDFMKLDIEGAECEVVGTSEFEKACERINTMIVEYHTWSQRNPLQLVTALSDYGYNVEKIPNTAAYLLIASK